jgi:hypothetical protein
MKDLAVLGHSPSRTGQILPTAYGSDWQFLHDPPIRPDCTGRRGFQKVNWSLKSFTRRHRTLRALARLPDTSDIVCATEDRSDAY